jgi:AraC-like DNA-binding protein
MDGDRTARIPGEGILFFGTADQNVVMSEECTVEVVSLEEDRLLRLADLQPSARTRIGARVVPLTSRKALDDLARLTSAWVALRGLLLERMFDELTLAVEHAVASLASRALWGDRIPTVGSNCCGYTRRALAFLRANIEERPSVATIARIAGCSARNLQLAFTRDVGHSPLEVHRQMKLEEAHRRLSEGNINVKSVVQALGFSNAGRFAQEFRERFGLTPSELLQR